MIPPVVASDRGRAQTVFVFRQMRGCRSTLWYVLIEEKRLERRSIEGDRPVSVELYGLVLS